MERLRLLTQAVPFVLFARGQGDKLVVSAVGGSKSQILNWFKNEKLYRSDEVRCDVGELISDCTDTAQLPGTSKYFVDVEGP